VRRHDRRLERETLLTRAYFVPLIGDHGFDQD
jgi:hypothetical protein